MSPDTKRKTVTPLTDGCSNNCIAYSPAVFIPVTVSVSVLQHIIKLKRLRRLRLNYTGVIGNATAVVF